MILADKIINERKKCGWSQEELAEKLSVSRQSVSKWEGAQSVPDLNKIIMMADIFNVTTDYLLKDEIEAEVKSDVTSKVDTDTLPPKRKVTMEEAREFMELKKEANKYNAIGTLLCILAPASLLSFLTVSEYNPSILNEDMATLFGLITLFIMICLAIFIFITRGNVDKKYHFLYEEDFETEYGVSGMLLEKKAAFENTKNTRKAAGVLAIIISVIPLIVASMLDAADWVALALVVFILLVVAGSVFNFIMIGRISTPIEILLQEGEFTQNSKKNAKKLTPISTAFWCLATAVFLGYSFVTGDWGRSWIVWPVGGVLYAVVRSIAKMVMKLED